MENFTALDLETTGLSPKLDEIIEIGAVRFREGKEVASFGTLLNPGRVLNDHIIELTGIHNEDMKEAPVLSEVLPELFSFLGDDVLLGHRILFDYSFLKKAAVNHKLSFEKKGLDTLKLTRKYMPELPSKRLSDACASFGIAFQAHRAIDDARACASLYLHLRDRFEEIENEKPEQLHFQVKKESPASKRQKERLYQLLLAHKIEIDRDIERLTKNEASRLTDKIILQYGRVSLPCPPKK